MTDAQAMYTLAGFQETVVELFQIPHAVTSCQKSLEEKGLWDLFLTIGRARVAAKQQGAKLRAIVCVVDKMKGNQTELKFLAQPNAVTATANSNSHPVKKDALPAKATATKKKSEPKGAALAMAFDGGEM